MMTARIAIAAGALLAIAVFIPSSLAEWAAVDRPLLASRIAPWNATAAANAAASFKNPRNEQSRALIRRALARDLTQISAIELRALDLAASGKSARARTLFSLSNQLSRRSLPTRLWLIQDAVDRGNVADALKNFDIALRTNTDAQPILFPILARATADPTLTAILAALLDQPSNWRQMFFEWTFANERDARDVANVVARMKDKTFVTANGDDQRLIERLATARQFSQARSLYDAFQRSTAGGGAVADTHFRDPDARYPFGWGLVNNGSLGAERTLSGSSAALSYRAAPANSGQVAAQLLTLAPGRYVLETLTASRGTGSAPYWSISCGKKAGAELVRLNQPMVAGSRAEAVFTVPAGCNGQWLTLTLRSADISPQSGSIASIAVTASL
jgi:hypothetical protein